MVGNIIILLIVIGLTVLFGWLTYRAVLAKKRWVKILGGLGADGNPSRQHPLSGGWSSPRRMALILLATW
jgi:hypothetical protein